MKLFHHITVLSISEAEKSNFSQAGVEFTVTRGSRGECIEFDLGEEDSRWPKVAALLEALGGTRGIEKKYRVQDLRMTAPTMEENLRRMQERVAAHIKAQPDPAPLGGYSDQSAAELLSLEGKYRTDSLIMAFEQAIRQKAEREGMQSLADEERVVLAIEALEREVNNGGYDQFFVNSSREFAPTIVGALLRIGCKKTARITERAILAIGVSELTEATIEAAMSEDDEGRTARLSRCDDSYHTSGEQIGERLFAFLKVNEAHIGL